MKFCDCSVHLVLMALISVQMGWVFFHYKLLPKVLILSVAFAFLNTLAALIESGISAVIQSGWSIVFSPNDFLL